MMGADQLHVSCSGGLGTVGITTAVQACLGAGSFTSRQLLRFAARQLLARDRVSLLYLTKARTLAALGHSLPLAK